MQGAAAALACGGAALWPTGRSRPDFVIAATWTTLPPGIDPTRRSSLSLWLEVSQIAGTEFKGTCNDVEMADATAGVAVVTGASRGVGRLLALHLARTGTLVVAVA